MGGYLHDQDLSGGEAGLYSISPEGRGAVSEKLGAVSEGRGAVSEKQGAVSEERGALPEG